MDLKKQEPNLIEFIKQGRTVLFLGSGVNFACKNNVDPAKSPPMGNALRDLLNERFLGGKFKNSSLTEVAEYSIAVTGLIEVQEYVRSEFAGFAPSDSQKRLTSIAWKGIATTNYDILIESAYSNSPGAAQHLVPLIDQRDDFVQLLKDSCSVPYIKLHGCFSRIGPKDRPLILSTDQYADYRNGRESLFDTLEEWASMHTIVFVGYSGQDQNIRKYVTHLVANLEHRPRFFLVKPTFEAVEEVFWTSRRVTPLACSFDDFVTAVDLALSGEFRGLRVHTTSPTSLTKHFRVHDVELSSNASLFVSKDCEYVADVVPSNDIDPVKFYRGYSEGWQAIIQELDMNRPVADDILTQFFLLADLQKRSPLQIVLISGYAGSGKTITMKRIAWEASHSYDCVCFFMNPEGRLNIGAVQELVETCKERLFIFIDDANERVGELRKFIRELRDQGQLVTLILGARTNEWNTASQQIDFSITEKFEMGDLNHREITSLIAKLDENNSLLELESLTMDQRIERLKTRAGRNLLVALHEATHGKPFEDIIVDEYNNLNLEKTRQLYLSVCVLNRLGIGVRAGLVSRLHGISFDAFTSEFFAPLEHVVFTRMDKTIGDMVYTARHPIIAEIVFRRILSNQDERFEHYHRALSALNLGYSTDEKAFREMIRGRVLNVVFPDSQFVQSIYAKAEEKVGDHPFLLHQKGVFEMNRASPNFSLAKEYLDRAERLEPRNTSIKHSQSELLLKKAGAARTSLEREVLLKNAKEVAMTIAKTETTSHSIHTLAKIAIVRVKDAIEDDLVRESAPAIHGLVKDAELIIQKGLQSFPGDPYLLESRAMLAKLINDAPKAMSSLKTAFEANKKVSYLALQLFSCYLESGKIEDAEGVLKDALDAKPGDRRLCFAYGCFLMDRNRSAIDSVYYFRRPYTPGDDSYDAQIRHGRELFRAGEYAECDSIFRRLHEKGRAGRYSGVILHRLADEFSGQVMEISLTYARVREDRSKLVIYVKQGDIDIASWKCLKHGSRLSFMVGFNTMGPIGIATSGAS